VRVVDNGVGMPAEVIPHVFDLFTQVNRTLDRAQGGLGIGLALVRQLVALHGGSVSADSRARARGARSR
jgi:signal transduction histidine kinase